MGSCYAAVLANNWEIPAKIEAEYDGVSLDVAQSTRIMRTDGTTTTYEPFTGELQPGEVAVVFLSEQSGGIASVACPAGVNPAVRKLTSSSGTRRDPTFRIKTTAPVSAYSVYPFGGAMSQASSSTMLLPVASWKKDYSVTSPWEMRHFFDEYQYPTTHVVAAEDGTEITLVGSVHIQAGKDVEPAEKGNAKTYHLKRGEHLQFFQEQELTGSRIGSNKPIGVWTGHQAMAIPTARTCCGDPSQRPCFPCRHGGTSTPSCPTSHAARRKRRKIISTGLRPRSTGRSSPTSRARRRMRL